MDAALPAHDPGESSAACRAKPLDPRRHAVAHSLHRRPGYFGPDRGDPSGEDRARYGSSARGGRDDGRARAGERSTGRGPPNVPGRTAPSRDSAGSLPGAVGWRHAVDEAPRSARPTGIPTPPPPAPMTAAGAPVAPSPLHGRRRALPPPGTLVPREKPESPEGSSGEGNHPTLRRSPTPAYPGCLTNVPTAPAERLRPAAGTGSRGAQAHQQAHTPRRQRLPAAPRRRPPPGADTGFQYVPGGRIQAHLWRRGMAQSDRAMSTSTRWVSPATRVSMAVAAQNHEGIVVLRLEVGPVRGTGAACRGRALPAVGQKVAQLPHSLQKSVSTATCNRWLHPEGDASPPPPPGLPSTRSDGKPMDRGSEA